MGEVMLRMRVKGVAMPSTDASPVIILEEDHGEHEICVTVGAAEAGAILMELEGVSMPRPLTHELFAQMFKEQGISIRRIELYGLYGAGEDGFLARMEYGRGWRTWTRDVRPSDALALAVAVNAPVFAHQSLVYHSRQVMESEAVAPMKDDYWFVGNHRA
jgi:bifunctional DNase/RNase